MKKVATSFFVLLLFAFIAKPALAAFDMQACLASGKSQNTCDVEACVETGKSQVTCEYETCINGGSTPSECHGIIDAAGVGSVFVPTYPDQVDNLRETSQNGSWGLESTVQAIVGTSAPAAAVLIAEPQLDESGAITMKKDGGAIGFLTTSMDSMIKTRPVSGFEYVAYMGSQLHVPGAPEQVYAAPGDPIGGRGLYGLTPVLNIWILSRNLAYFLFSIVFVIVGIMIMTRRKIDPKTAASIQNALPKIIFALIIVTFSYAIAGFLIDIMYVALALIVTLMGSLPEGPVNVPELLSGSIFGFVANGYFDVTLSVAQNVAGIVNGILNLSRDAVSGSVTGFITGGLAFLIVAVAILVALFRTWLALIGAFANVILAVIFAPLRLTMDALPGQNQFTAWVKDLLANLLTFPLVTILLAIGAYIASYPGEKTVPGFAPPLLGAGTTAEVLPFVGLGILLTIPKALDILRETFKAPGFKYGGAWMESMTAGVAGSRFVGGATYKAGSNVPIIPGSEAGAPRRSVGQVVGARVLDIKNRISGNY